MVHNNVSLTVSQSEATKADDEAKKRLIASRKLSLVVDLDQTIIHATVDPTVGDWKRDGENPNHDAVKGVEEFVLKDDHRLCTYYIKLRPGLAQFLDIISKMYELHIYTMGTRQYAKKIANIIDRDHKIFGDRILSRDESGSMTAKNLRRLFPVDTKMVVIIDDRGDVWQWSPNLIKVTPYDFFVGIGDINSSFLPKKQGAKPLPKAAVTAAQNSNEDLAEGATKNEPEPKPNGVKTVKLEAPPAENPSKPNPNASPLERLVAMGGSDDTTTREAQASEQGEAIAAQLEERPLLQKQKKLEADDAASETTATKEDGGENKPTVEEPSDSDRPKHNLLQDDDRELYFLEESLRSVHTAFFDAFQREMTGTQGGRLGQLRGGQKRKFATEDSDLDLVPDVKTVLPAVKARVLGGVVLVFSGVIPLGMDIESTDIAILARMFGARIDDDISRSTTHVVAARNRTVKVRKAMKRGKGRIKVVNPKWLTDSISSWTKKDETSYVLDVEEGKNGPAEHEDILSESESPPAGDSDETDNDSKRSSSLQTLTQAQQIPSKPSLKLNTKPRSSQTDDDESDFEGVAPSGSGFDDGSPVGGDNEDWTAMNDELADFLGSEAGDESEDEGDGNSVASGISIDSSKLSHRGKKRGWDDIASGGESESVQKSKKHSNGGMSTPLSQNTNAMTLSVGGGDGDGDGEETGIRDAEEDGDNENEVEGDGWSDFEEDLEAEMEKAAQEERRED